MHIKNWQMIDTIHGAKSSAIIYSIVETAKANNLKPFDYVQYLLEEIPKHMDDRDGSFLEAYCPGLKNFRQESAKLKYRWLQGSHLKKSRYLLFGVYFTASLFLFHRKLRPMSHYLKVKNFVLYS